MHLNRTTFEPVSSAKTTGFRWRKVFDESCRWHQQQQRSGLGKKRTAGYETVTPVFKGSLTEFPGEILVENKAAPHLNRLGDFRSVVQRGKKDRNSCHDDATSPSRNLRVAHTSTGEPRVVSRMIITSRERRRGGASLKCPRGNLTVTGEHVRRTMARVEAQYLSPADEQAVRVHP